MEIDRTLLLQTFAAEADEQLQVMEQGLVALELRPADAELLAAVFRAAHTFKGNAAVVGLEALALRAHVIEDALDSMRTHAAPVSSGAVSELLTTLDTLRSELRQSLAREPVDLAGTSALGPDDGAFAANRHRTLRIDAAKLDRMLSLSGEISIARGRLRAQLAAEDAHGAELRLAAALETHLEADRLHRELQEEIMQARMVPVGPMFRQYQRVVRDLALSLGKRVALSITGEDVELDTTVSDHVRDPIMHMLRNALDHGIETPERRSAAGKDPVGRLTLGARREANSIFIELSDDGAGFDTQRIAQRARQLGDERASELGEEELLRLVMEPGFSTADGVSELSGRGVGMDVVRRNIDALRGTVSIASRRGQGSTIGLRLPLTLAIIDGFFVEVAGETYVLPLESVTECIELPSDQRTHADGCGVHDFRGQALPYVRLRELFGLGGAPPRREHLAIVRHGERQAGIAIDAPLGQDQAVIKPLSKLFHGIAAVAGSTITGSGHVALILDVAAVLDLAVARAPGSRGVTDSSREVA
jgi:two-component system chemotaxis sensor kinase CheA